MNHTLNPNIDTSILKTYYPEFFSEIDEEKKRKELEKRISFWYNVDKEVGEVLSKIYKEMFESASD